jgi:hypothetical protein
MKRKGLNPADPVIRARRAQEWREWRKRSPAGARNGFVYLRSFFRDMLDGEGGWVAALSHSSYEGSRPR